MEPKIRQLSILRMPACLCLVSACSRYRVAHTCVNVVGKTKPGFRTFVTPF